MAVLVLSIVIMASGCGSGWHSAAQNRTDQPPHIVIISAEDEYRSEQTLPVFAQKLHKEHGYRVTVVLGDKEPRYNVPGMDALASADLAIIYIRRVALPQEQLQHMRDYVASGRPLVALRTSNHAFAVRGEAPPNLAQWPEFDHDVIGGNYTGHYRVGRNTTVSVVPEAADHPILRDVPHTFTSTTHLYQVRPLSPNTRVLLMGAVEGEEPEPVLWTHQRGRQRVVYTSLGDIDDFATESFNQLLLNMVDWALQ